MQEIQIRLTTDETNLILEALGQLPFARVFELVGKIQQQARAQLRAAEPAAEGPTGTAGGER